MGSRGIRERLPMRDVRKFSHRGIVEFSTTIEFFSNSVGFRVCGDEHSSSRRVFRQPFRYRNPTVGYRDGFNFRNRAFESEFPIGIRRTVFREFQFQRLDDSVLGFFGN